MSDLLAHETIAPDDAHGETDATAPELDALFAKRTSTRKAVARLALALVSLGIVAAVIVAALPSGLVARLATLTTLPARVTPSPTSPPFHTQVWITSDVRYGALILNGKRLSGPPPQAVALRNGDNTVILDAPPFPALKCSVRGPLTVGADGTLIAGSVNDSPYCTMSWDTSGASGAIVIIAIQLSGDDLAPAIQASALDAVNRVLAAIPARTTTVPAGQYFASGVDQRGLPISQFAAEPLTATVDFSPVEPGATPAPSVGFMCPTMLCPGSPALPHLPYFTPTGTDVFGWDVKVPVTERWRFSTASGKVVSVVNFLAAQPLQLRLAYDSSAGWRADTTASSEAASPMQSVTSQLDGVMDPCSQGMQMVSLAVGPGGQNGLTSTGALSGVLEGCAITVVSQTGHAQGQFIWRFGALLAADAGAYALLPTLPMAPVAEIKAVGAFGG